MKKNWYRQMKQRSKCTYSMCDGMNSEMNKSLIMHLTNGMNQQMRATNWIQIKAKPQTVIYLLLSVCECSCENVQFKCNH